MNKLFNRFLILCLLGTAPALAEEEHADEGSIPPMSAKQRQAIGIFTQTVSQQSFADEVVVRLYLSRLKRIQFGRFLAELAGKCWTMDTKSLYDVVLF